MKTQLKVLSLLAAALAVVFSTAGVPMDFSAPGEMMNCRSIDSGLSFECDPVSNLVVVNSGVIPVTGLGLPSFTTSLRRVNDFTPSATELILADFVGNPSVVATSLRGVNDFTPSATELILADFVANPSVVATSLRGVNSVAATVPLQSLNDAALTLQAEDSKMMPVPAPYYYGAR